MTGGPEFADKLTNRLICTVLVKYDACYSGSASPVRRLLKVVVK